MYCAQCGTVVSANSRFCVGCGARVTDPGAAAGSGTLTLTPNGEEQLLVSVRRALAADYDVERELGRGGMAVVFKARDKELDRPVALKVLPPELAPVATVADRFKREARLAASLDHPNVIPVYRVGQAGGVLYMAMKFIDGRPLDALVAEHGPLPLPVVLTVLRAAARAMAYAHDHGIVHRDIKGANILIDRDGRVVVSDFGIARAVESATLTATGVMIGTPHFMSPEQCAGKPVGPQSDQYSLGIVAYQLLTGSVPFDGDSLPEILQHHWFTPPPDASLLRPETPAALTAAVLRLLDKDPARRFASTNDLVVALETIPFSASERAAGEAGLRALVAPPATPAGIGAPGANQQPTAVSGHSGAGAPEGLASSAPTAVVGSRSTPATRAIEESRGGKAAVPTVAAQRTGDALARSTKSAVSRGDGTPLPQHNTTHPGSRGLTTRAKSTAPTSTRRRARRWRALGVAAMLVLVAGAGTAVAARRSTLNGFVRTTSPTSSARLNAAKMRDAGGKAYQAGDYELARRFFVRALAAQPGDARAQEQLGCALLKLGRADSARAFFAASGVKQKCP